MVIDQVRFGSSVSDSTAHQSIVLNAVGPLATVHGVRTVHGIMTVQQYATGCCRKDGFTHKQSLIYSGWDTRELTCRGRDILRIIGSYKEIIL